MSNYFFSTAKSELSCRRLEISRLTFHCDTTLRGMQSGELENKTHPNDPKSMLQEPGKGQKQRTAPEVMSAKDIKGQSYLSLSFWCGCTAERVSCMFTSESKLA
jgi:hypothetical protein